jgi:tol-pal system protein YbgF
MSVTVNDLQQKLNTQNDAVGGKVDTVSGQVQSLNDSVDELKTRIAKLDKTVQDLQTQLQNMQTAPQPGATQGGVPASAGTMPAIGPASGQPEAGQTTPNVPQMSQTPPLQQTFQSGVRDYNAGKYEVATGEFQDVLHYYPLDEMAGSAQFYLGEIAYRQKNFSGAVKAYNAVLEGFPGSPKAPAAQLRKSLALLQMDKKEAAITELRLLIRRHPQTPEAAQARAKLSALGVKASAAH